MSRRDHGYVALRYMDGNTLTFAAFERERLVSAFRDGTRYFEGVDEYGGELCVLMDDARAVCYFSPDAIAQSRAEDALDRVEGLG